MRYGLVLLQCFDGSFENDFCRFSKDSRVWFDVLEVLFAVVWCTGINAAIFRIDLMPASSRYRGKGEFRWRLPNMFIFLCVCLYVYGYQIGRSTSAWPTWAWNRQWGRMLHNRSYESLPLSVRSVVLIWVTMKVSDKFETFKGNRGPMFFECLMCYWRSWLLFVQQTDIALDFYIGCFFSFWRSSIMQRKVLWS